MAGTQSQGQSFKYTIHHLWTLEFLFEAIQIKQIFLSGKWQILYIFINKTRIWFFNFNLIMPELWKVSKRMELVYYANHRQSLSEHHHNSCMFIGNLRHFRLKVQQHNKRQVGNVIWFLWGKCCYNIFDFYIDITC